MDEKTLSLLERTKLNTSAKVEEQSESIWMDDWNCVEKKQIYPFEIAIEIWCGTSEDCISEEFKDFMGSAQIQAPNTLSGSLTWSWIILIK